MKKNKLTNGYGGFGAIVLISGAISLGGCTPGASDAHNPNQNTPTYTDLHPKIPLNQQPSHPGEIPGRPETMLADQSAMSEAGTVPAPEPSYNGAHSPHARGKGSAKKPPAAAMENQNKDHPAGNSSNGGSTGLTGSGAGTSSGAGTTSP